MELSINCIDCGEEAARASKMRIRHAQGDRDAEMDVGPTTELVSTPLV